MNHTAMKHRIDHKLLPKANWRTKQRGTNSQEYEIYRDCASDGKGGDITRNGAPLLSYDEWLAS